MLGVYREVWGRGMGGVILLVPREQDMMGVSLDSDYLFLLVLLLILTRGE